MGFGKLKINLMVMQRTNIVELNSKNLIIDERSITLLDDASHSISPIKLEVNFQIIFWSLYFNPEGKLFQYKPELEKLLLQLPKQLFVGKHYFLSMKYSVPINDKVLLGLYATSYKENGETKSVIFFVNFKYYQFLS